MSTAASLAALVEPVALAGSVLGPLPDAATPGSPLSAGFPGSPGQVSPAPSCDLYSAHASASPSGLSGTAAGNFADLSPLMIAVGLSVLSAACYAAAAVVQERLAAGTAVRGDAAALPGTGTGAGAGAETGTGGTVPAPAAAGLFSRGPGWAAIALNALGAALHVAALRSGPLILVQPLGALTLVLAVPLGAAVAGRRAGPGEWRGTALALTGLAGLVLATSPAALPRALGAGQVLLLCTGTAAAVMALVRFRIRNRSPFRLPGAGSGTPAVLGGRAARGPRRPGPRRRGSSSPGRAAASGLRYAAAAGIVFGTGSALAQSVATGFARHGVGGWSRDEVLVSVLLLVPLPLGGLLLAHTAYRAGLNGPLATVTLANPATAALIGLVLLGEGFRGGLLGAALAVVSAMAAARGVILLTRRPGPADPPDGGRPGRVEPPGGKRPVPRCGGRRTPPPLPGPGRETVTSAGGRRRLCPARGEAGKDGGGAGGPVP